MQEMPKRESSFPTEFLKPVANAGRFPPGTLAWLSFRGRGTAGRSGTARPWILTIEPARPQWLEPLMGWIAGDDPLRHVEIRFSTREAALRFAARQGLEIAEVPARQRQPAKPPRTAAQMDAAVNSEWQLYLEEETACAPGREERAAAELRPAIGDMIEEACLDGLLFDRASDDGMPELSASPFPDALAARRMRERLAGTVLLLLHPHGRRLSA